MSTQTPLTEQYVSVIEDLACLHEYSRDITDSVVEKMLFLKDNYLSEKYEIELVRPILNALDMSHDLPYIDNLKLINQFFTYGLVHGIKLINIGQYFDQYPLATFDYRVFDIFTKKQNMKIITDSKDMKVCLCTKVCSNESPNNDAPIEIMQFINVFYAGRLQKVYKIVKPRILFQDGFPYIVSLITTIETIARCQQKAA